jgi:hypothetical protein
LRTAACPEREAANAAEEGVMRPWLGPTLLAAVCLATGCATHYAYSFRVTDPGVRPATAPGQPDTIEDADLVTAILVDATAESIVLAVSNKTDQILAVDWAGIALAHPDGARTTMRPDVDLGWIQPGASVTARLFPLALPRTGGRAAAYQGQRFVLSVPMVVRREPRVVEIQLASRVTEQ